MSLGQKLIVVIVAIFVLCFLIYKIGNYAAKRYISKKPNSMLNLTVTRFGYVFYSISIAILLVGFSMKWFAPDTILGRLVSSHTGMVLYALGIVIIIGVVEKSLFVKGYKTTEKKWGKEPRNTA